MIRRLLARLFAPPVPPEVQAYRDALQELHAERESELRRDLATERLGDEGRNAACVAEEMFADGLISSTQAQRMLGRESEIPLRPTRFARRLGKLGR